MQDSLPRSAEALQLLVCEVAVKNVPAPREPQSDSAQGFVGDFERGSGNSLGKRGRVLPLRAPVARGGPGAGLVLRPFQGHGWDLVHDPGVVAEPGQLLLLGAGAAVCGVQGPCVVALVEVGYLEASRIGGRRGEGRIRVSLVEEVEEAGEVALEEVGERDLPARDDGRARTAGDPARVAPVAAQVSALVAGALVSLRSVQRLLGLLGVLVSGAKIEFVIRKSIRHPGQRREADSGTILMVGGSLWRQPLLFGGGASLGAFPPGG
jgi:hypothetical protein